MSEEWFVGRLHDFAETGRVVVQAAGTEVGVFQQGSTFYAYENRCLHQGGPACEGLVLGKVVQHLSADKKVLREGFSSDNIHFVCPWHGWEYEMATGRCAADPTMRLRRFEVVQRDDAIYIRA